jgi:WD40 repeat protein
MVFADNEQLIMWGMIGKFAVVWEMPSGKLLTPAREDLSGIHSIGFSADGKEVVTSCTLGRISRWDAATGKHLGRVAVNLGPSPYEFILSRDATRGLCLNTAAIFDLSNGEELFTVPNAPHLGKTSNPIYTARHPSPDFKWVISSSFVPDFERLKSGAALVVWDVANQKKVTTVELPKAVGGLKAKVSPSGARLVTVHMVRSENDKVDFGGENWIVTGWDLKTGKKLAELELNKKDSGAVLSITAASENHVLVTSHKRLWTVDYERGRKGEEIDSLGEEENGSFGPIVFSADGKYFAVAFQTDKSPTYGIRVYDWSRRRKLHTFASHREPITVLAFSPDGKTLASGSHDTTVLLWDLTKIGQK